MEIFVDIQIQDPKFQIHYPEWKYRYNIHEILTEIVKALNE